MIYLFQNKRNYFIQYSKIVFLNEVEAPIVLGGNRQRNRVEVDELEKGHRQKGQHGHKGIIQGNIWGARGIDVNDGRKKWLVFP